MSTTDLTLYAIEETRLAMLDTLDLVPTDEERMALLKDIAEQNALAVDKRNAVIAFRQTLIRRMEALREEAKRMLDLAATIENKVDAFDSYLVRVIQQFAPEPKRGAKKLEGTIGTLSIRKNPDSCEVEDIEALPSRFKTVTITLLAEVWDALKVQLPNFCASLQKIDFKTDKKAIKEAIQAGEDVPGADIRFGAFRLEVK